MLRYNFFTLLMLSILCPFPSLAGIVADGIYTGAYKVTFVGQYNQDSKIGDTGVFEFLVKDNKIIKIHDYDDESFNQAKSKYYIDIDEKTGVVDGYLRQTRLTDGLVILKIRLKGKFINQMFAGEAKVQVSSPVNFTAEKLVFESLN